MVRRGGKALANLPAKHRLPLLYPAKSGGVKKENTISCVPLLAYPLTCTGIATVEPDSTEEVRSGNRESGFNDRGSCGSAATKSVREREMWCPVILSGVMQFAVRIA